MPKLTQTIVTEAKPEDKEYFIYDVEVPGFALRIYPSGHKTLTYQYRAERKSRRINLGNATVMKMSFARELAREHAHEVARGGDPLARRETARSAATVRQLSFLFEERHVLYLKDSTGREYRRALRNTILPAIGHLKVAEVTRANVADIFYGLRDKPVQANRTLEIISKMFNLAEEWELRAPNTNPRRGIKKNPETKRERFLSEAELARVGEVLAEMEVERIEMLSAIEAIRLLILTGCRLGEIMTLKWAYVDFRAGCLRLPDSKTGKKDVPLAEPAIEVLQAIERVQGNPFVIKGRDGLGRLADLQPFWQRVRARAGLIDARIHDLRHTFASTAASQGMSLQVIGKMLGHKTLQSTQRYAHLAGGTMRQAANDVATSLSRSMGVGQAG